MKRFYGILKRAHIALLLCAICSGCASITWETPDGGKASVRRFVWKGSFNRLLIKTDTATVYVYGYAGKADEEVTKSLLEGIIAGLK